MESDGMLRHLAFFEELGRMDEHDASWRAVSAGLVTMRLVDAWIADGPSVSRVDAWGVSAVREAIAQVSETTPIRRILSSIVDVMVASTAVDLHAMVPRLMAYAQSLEYEAKWHLAADVYATIIAHAHPREDSDLAIAAHLQLAFCLRTVGDLDEASETYEQATRLASSVGDLIGVLRGRLGDAKIAVARGNLPEAEMIVTETMERAEANGLVNIRARALGDRVTIAGLRGQHDNVIRYAYEAVETATDPRDKDRNLTNIATAFRHLGLTDVARDAYLILVATAQEQYVRWAAGLNLMELCAADGSELQFDKYRRDYESADFTPFLRVMYLLHVGRGYHALSQPKAGIPYLEKAIDLARNHGLNQLLFEAEQALTDAKRDERSFARTKVRGEVGRDLQSVIDAIHDMKATAGIDG